MAHSLDWTHKARTALLAWIIGFASICVMHTMTYANVPYQVDAERTEISRPFITEYSFLNLKEAFFSKQSFPVPSIKPDFENRLALSNADQGRYARVFVLQVSGDIKAANKILKDIKDKTLMGHVLYQRYMHPTAYTSTFEELRDWMASYADHPGAKDVYELALSKMPKGYDGELIKPATGKHLARAPEPGMRRGKAFKATKSFSHAKYKEAKNAVINAEKALFTGQIEDALAGCKAVADQSGDILPDSAWVAGLSYWQKGDFTKAAKYFERVAVSEYASGWQNAAGAFWAARAHMRVGNVSEVTTWLEKASDNPRTFYGLLAVRALGQDFDFNWEEPTFTNEHFKLLSSTSEGRRAMALVSVGQAHRAEDELMVLEPDTSEMREAMIAYAFYADLPALAMRLGALYKGRDGHHYDAALYPVSPWTPENGYDVDPALIHAIMRQESRFDPEAESHSGARGLMQLMPSTASYVSGAGKYKSRKGVHLLEDPKTNIDIGQRYVQKLFRSKQIKDDLLAMLMAYNAGPGNLQRWKSNLENVQDPLLFIELIPIEETRIYVERVLSNYWIYRDRDGLDTPSLDALAAGRVARYAGMPGTLELAALAQ